MNVTGCLAALQKCMVIVAACKSRMFDTMEWCAVGFGDGPRLSSGAGGGKGISSYMAMAVIWIDVSCLCLSPTSLGIPTCVLRRANRVRAS